jgi:glycerol-3-phosphate acyltransferase PlsY
MIYYLVLFYQKHWLPWESLLLLALCVFSFVHISKKGEIVGATVLPVLSIVILVFSPVQKYQVFILSIIAYIFLVDILNIRRSRLLNASLGKMKTEINWRLYLRPLAVLLVINYLRADKKQALTLIGSIALFFLLLDLIRLFSTKVNVFFFKKVKDLYKSREYSKFSSITIFLFAGFLTVLLFEKPIAVLAVSYLIFGDFFSKFFGIHFGRTKIFEKTLEGSLAHFNACLIAGYIFLHFVSVPIPAYLTGVFVASVSEVLPLGVNDNFSVALLSASSMYVFLLF